MKMRRERHGISLVLSGALLVFVAALLAVTVALVRTKLLKNAQDFGMALVQSYAIEETMNIENLKTSVRIASQYVDEIVKDGGDPGQVQQWLAGYFRKPADLKKSWLGSSSLTSSQKVDCLVISQCVCMSLLSLYQLTVKEK